MGQKSSKHLVPQPAQRDSDLYTYKGVQTATYRSKINAVDTSSATSNAPGNATSNTKQPRLSVKPSCKATGVSKSPAKESDNHVPSAIPVCTTAAATKYTHGIQLLCSANASEPAATSDTSRCFCFVCLASESLQTKDTNHPRLPAGPSCSATGATNPSMMASDSRVPSATTVCTTTAPAKPAHTASIAHNQPKPTTACSVETYTISSSKAASSSTTETSISKRTSDDQNEPRPSHKQPNTVQRERTVECFSIPDSTYKAAIRSKTSTENPNADDGSKSQTRVESAVNSATMAPSSTITSSNMKSPLMSQISKPVAKVIAIRSAPKTQVSQVASRIDDPPTIVATTNNATTSLEPRPSNSISSTRATKGSIKPTAPVARTAAAAPQKEARAVSRIQEDDKPSPPIGWRAMFMMDTSQIPLMAPMEEERLDYFARITWGADGWDDAPIDTKIPVYIMSVTDENVCLFEPMNSYLIDFPNKKRCKPGDIWAVKSIKPPNLGHPPQRMDEVVGLVKPSDDFWNQLRSRKSWDCDCEERYRYMILHSLLLGCRVRDFEQNCAVVEKLRPLTLSMSSVKGLEEVTRLKEDYDNRGCRYIVEDYDNPMLRIPLKTTRGETFEVLTESVTEKKGDKKLTAVCNYPENPLSHKIGIGAQLEITKGTRESVVARALMAGSWPRDTFDNWKLISLIYGKTRELVKSEPFHTSIRIKMAKGQAVTSRELNPQQLEAVMRYNDDSCPAYVIEAPPGSGKTFTAAAMAVSYKGEGVQLFLSTANVPVTNMARALADLDMGKRTALHLISAEKEESRSPFTAAALARRCADLREEIEEVEYLWKYEHDDWSQEQLKKGIKKVYRKIYDLVFNIYFATVDTILGRLLKTYLDEGDREVKDVIRSKLKRDVRRIIVDEASQLTEAALNALILSFPKAQIVLIGDSKQLPPFKYSTGDVVSQLSGRSSLAVCSDKRNLTVIQLTQVYRTSQTLMAHYSDVFYEGSLQSCKQNARVNPFSKFGPRVGSSRLIFWKVNGQQQQSGTSKVNLDEINALTHIITTLRESGYTSKSVMIICYYDAQRKIAQAAAKDYEVLTVDSAQGRENKIVIVLTTRTSVSQKRKHTGDFFSCPLRCNVAVSRHQEALIVIGHPSIASAPNWRDVLSPKYFKHVEPLGAKAVARKQNGSTPGNRNWKVKESTSKVVNGKQSFFGGRVRNRRL